MKLSLHDMVNNTCVDMLQYRAINCIQVVVKNALPHYKIEARCEEPVLMYC